MSKGTARNRTAEDVDEEILRALQAIERRISALLSVMVDQTLRNTPELAKPRPRSIDKLLSDAGLQGVEIANLLGKSPQAVSQALKASVKQTKKCVEEVGTAVQSSLDETNNS